MEHLTIDMRNMNGYKPMELNGLEEFINLFTGYYSRREQDRKKSYFLANNDIHELIRKHKMYQIEEGKLRKVQEWDIRVNLSIEEHNTLNEYMNDFKLRD